MAQVYVANITVNPSGNAVVVEGMVDRVPVAVVVPPGTSQAAALQAMVNSKASADPIRTTVSLLQPLVGTTTTV